MIRHSIQEKDISWLEAHFAVMNEQGKWDIPYWLVALRYYGQP